MLRLVVASLGLVLSLSACSSGNATSVADGGAARSNGGDGSSGDGGSGDGGPPSSDPDGGGGSSTCEAKGPTASAEAEGAFVFDGIDFGGGAVGFDRDGKCTREVSTDVCMSEAGTVVPDANDGVDNAFGQRVAPELEKFVASFRGSLATDATGKGTLSLESTMDGAILEIPLRAAKIERTGASALVSAVISTDELVKALRKVLPSFSTSFCSGSNFARVEKVVRDASDIGERGEQKAGSHCDGITIGAMLTGVRDGVASPLPPSPDPCSMP